MDSADRAKYIVGCLELDFFLLTSMVLPFDAQSAACPDFSENNGLPDAWEPVKL